MIYQNYSIENIIEDYSLIQLPSVIYLLTEDQKQYVMMRQQKLMKSCVVFFRHYQSQLLPPRRGDQNFFAVGGAGFLAASG